MNNQPNSLELSKTAYLHKLLTGRKYNANLIDAALIFYLAEIPIEVSTAYMNKLEEKLKKTFTRNTKD